MENKYRRFLFRLGKGTLGVFLMLFSVALGGLAIFGIIYAAFVSIYLALMLFALGWIFDMGFGIAFGNDQFESSNFVSDGTTSVSIKRTKKHILRRSKFWAVTSILYIIYGLVCVFLGIKEQSMYCEGYKYFIVYYVATGMSLVGCIACIVAALINKEDARIGNYDEE